MSIHPTYGPNNKSNDSIQDKLSKMVTLLGLPKEIWLIQRQLYDWKVNKTWKMIHENWISNISSISQLEKPGRASPFL